MATNVLSYAQCGIAWLRLYQPRQTLPAETKFAKPLKPSLRMSCCYLLGFIIIHFLVYYLPLIPKLPIN